MKNPLIWIIALVLIGGVLYWLLAPAETVAPTPDADVVTEQPDDAAPGDETNLDADYIGLTEADAETLAVENDVPFRVVERNGEQLPTTRDYRPGRINATVNAGVVTDYQVEGQTEDDANRADGNTQGDPDANRYDFGGEPATPDEPEEEAREHDAIIGMSEADAIAYAAAEGVPFRVGFRDGEPLPLTMDYRPGRITASIEDGVVAEYTVEGQSEDTAAGEHDAIIGMSVVSAVAYAQQNDVPFRLGSIDGVPQALTEDYRPGRITATAVDGVITEYTVE